MKTDWSKYDDMNVDQKINTIQDRTKILKDKQKHLMSMIKRVELMYAETDQDR